MPILIILHAMQPGDGCRTLVGMTAEHTQHT
nr:MAG TPA: hypothetical protein [Caudoviricetes sp.]